MRQVSLTLNDPQSQDLAFKISDFENGNNFAGVNQYNYFSMLLIKTGSGTVWRDGASYTFEENCLLCFSIYQPFMIKPVGDFAGILINFHPSFFCLFKHRREVSCNGILFNNLYNTPAVKLISEDMHTLLNVTEQLKVEMQQHEIPEQEILISYLKIFLINAVRAKTDQLLDGPNATSGSHLLTEQLKNAVEEHFKTLRSPSDYGNLLNISEKALNRISKSQFRKTLTNLIAERMTIEAKRELYLTSKPVKQIAAELGYNDEFYFSRFFKKNVGVSPQIFRDKVGFEKLTA